MATIAFFELEKWEEEAAKKTLKRHALKFFSKPLTASNASKAGDAEAIAAFIYSRIDKKILAKLPKLKLIATMSTGYDHIDTEACRKKGVKVSNVPFYGENTVAEHTFALILALSRKILKSVENTRRGNFSLNGLRGFDLKGKTIGVVGTGHIGLHVLRIAKGFEMKMTAYDVKQDLNAAKKLGFRYVKLNTLLKSSDIITLHCPYNKATHHLINKSNIMKTKKGAYLINTARGGLIETDALLNALNRKHLGGAGIDVLEEESAIKEEKQLLSRNFTSNLRTILANHILLNYENVIITPHNAFNSTEALNRILTTTLENIQEYLKGKTINAVA
ncbi:hydroxyacid dehydrogenase [Candidatus Woesearchaeota archaeon]|nr:hydroxyacid dehydrogenase [Candidatus Woesearchaeota archaeon]